MTPREAAYLSLLASLRQEAFLAHTLGNWQRHNNPSNLDYAFAYEIASGSTRMANTLDYIAKQLATKQKLSLKLKEKALLRTAIYQHYFMSKVPLYAIVNETIEIAKKHCHRTFVNFLNALLRQLESIEPEIPKSNTPIDLSIRYSYPLLFIEQLIKDYGLDTSLRILSLGNQPPVNMARIRPCASYQQELVPFPNLNIAVACLPHLLLLSKISTSPDFYIQNATPIQLITNLAEKTNKPTKILDLCSSPGGKLIAVHDIYPQADLYANDVSQEKLERLTQNLSKYAIHSQLTCGPGESYPLGNAFDLIILDVPCSNSGVLNKRAEARWRLTEESFNQLKNTQLKLLTHALNLLTEQGSIWYLTCSILKNENEKLIEKFAQKNDLQVVFQQTILPNELGWDGGFGCLLKRK